MPFTTLDLSKQSGTSLPSSIVTASGLSTGKVLQVIEGDVTTATTITSTSYVDVSLEATITPASSSNKVLVMANCNNMKNNTSSGGNGKIRIQHDQGGGSFTDLQIYEGILGFNDNDVNNPTPMYLHSANTTNAIKYKIQVAQLSGFSSGSMRFNNRASDGGTIRSSIILMEIAA